MAFAHRSDLIDKWKERSAAGVAEIDKRLDMLAAISLDANDLETGLPQHGQRTRKILEKEKFNREAELAALLKWFVQLAATVERDVKKIEACAEVLPACQACGASSKKLLRCDKCRTTFYCNQECQEKARPSHKNKCTEPDGEPFAPGDVELKIPFGVHVAHPKGYVHIFPNKDIRIC